MNAATSFVLPAHDGLEEDWSTFKNVYVNPPYGTCYMNLVTRQVYSQKEFRALFPDKHQRAQALASSAWKKSTIADWVTKTAAFGKNAPAIMLIPAAVDTASWQKTIFPGASAVCFLKGRVRFNGAAAGAPMACAVVAWTRDLQAFRDGFGSRGHILTLG